MRLPAAVLGLSTALLLITQPERLSAQDHFSRMDINQAAKLFGERPSSFAPDLSPDGDKIVYLSAGPGATTVARILNVATGDDKPLVRSSGKPKQLNWCGFSDERWVVCHFGGEIKQVGMIYPVARTVVIDNMKGTIRQLGVLENSADAEGFEQFDGTVLDWLPEEKGAILMQRRYAAQNGYPERIGVDHIKVDPFRVSTVEPPVAGDVDYMTDGHGTVRFRQESRTDINELFT